MDLPFIYVSFSVAQSCPTVCNRMDSVHGILQPRILERITIPPPGDLLDLGIEPASLEPPSLAGEFFTTEPPGNPIFYVWEDAKVWALGNHSFAMNLSYLGPVSCAYSSESAQGSSLGVTSVAVC